MSKSLEAMIEDEARNIEQKVGVLLNRLGATSREDYTLTTLILSSAQRLEAWTKLSLDGES